MADENNQPNVENQTIPPNTDTIPTQDQPKKTGAVEHYKEQLNQTRLQMQKIEEEKIQMSQRLAQIEEEKMKAANQWQELADKYKREKEAVEKQHNDFRGYFVQEKKLETIKREALRAGIREEAIHDLDILDTSMVEIETTSTGKINVLNADQFVEGLKSSRPYWFKNQNAPNINTNMPNANMTKNYSPSEILKLQKTNPTEYNKIMQKMLQDRRK